MPQLCSSHLGLDWWLMLCKFIFNGNQAEFLPWSIFDIVDRMGCTLHQHGHGHSHGGGGHNHSHGHGHSHAPTERSAVVEKPLPVEGTVNKGYLPGSPNEDLERAEQDSQASGENENSSCSSSSGSTQVSIAKPQQNINVRAAYMWVKNFKSESSRMTWN